MTGLSDAAFIEHLLSYLLVPLKWAVWRLFSCLPDDWLCHRSGEVFMFTRKFNSAPPIGNKNEKGCFEEYTCPLPMLCLLYLATYLPSMTSSLFTLSVEQQITRRLLKYAVAPRQYLHKGEAHGSKWSERRRSKHPFALVAHQHFPLHQRSLRAALLQSTLSTKLTTNFL